VSREPEQRGGCQFTRTINEIHFSDRPISSEDDQMRRALRFILLPGVAATVGAPDLPQHREHPPGPSSHRETSHIRHVQKRRRLDESNGPNVNSPMPAERHRSPNSMQRLVRPERNPFVRSPGWRLGVDSPMAPSPGSNHLHTAELRPRERRARTVAAVSWRCRSDHVGEIPRPIGGRNLDMRGDPVNG
jgi:hypothetical protein